MGAEGKSRYIDPKNKLATAYHEVCGIEDQYLVRADELRQGGHALVALYTEGAMPLHKVTCLPRGHALGYVCSLRQTLTMFLTNLHQDLASARERPEFD